jgi:hypothetical protein
MICQICRRERTKYELTEYKFIKICVTCVNFFKNNVIIYGVEDKATITNINDYALNNINDD